MLFDLLAIPSVADSPLHLKHWFSSTFPPHNIITPWVKADALICLTDCYALPRQPVLGNMSTFLQHFHSHLTNFSFPPPPHDLIPTKINGKSPHDLDQRGDIGFRSQVKAMV